MLLEESLSHGVAPARISRRARRYPRIDSESSSSRPCRQRRRSSGGRSSPASVTSWKPPELRISRDQDRQRSNLVRYRPLESVRRMEQFPRKPAARNLLDESSGILPSSVRVGLPVAGQELHEPARGKPTRARSRGRRGVGRHRRRQEHIVVEVEEVFRGPSDGGSSHCLGVERRQSRARRSNVAVIDNADRVGVLAQPPVAGHQ